MTGVQAAPKVCLRVRPVICALTSADAGAMGNIVTVQSRALAGPLLAVIKPVSWAQGMKENKLIGVAGSSLTT